MRSFYWMQHFFNIILDFPSSVLSERQECLGLTYFVDNRQKYLMVVKNNSQFLVLDSGQYVCSIDENSKEWEELNLSYCRKMRSRGLNYDKIFCTGRSISLYK